MKVHAILESKADQSLTTVVVPHEAFTFNGGEEHIRFLPIQTPAGSRLLRLEITSRLTTSLAIMQLIMAVDALRRLFGPTTPLSLTCAYFPYARQDRVCNQGEALAAKVFADMINGLGFNQVTIRDAHSDVVPALLNNVVNETQLEGLKRHESLYNALLDRKYTLVAPDAGASKKTLSLAQQLGGLTVVQADKVRNTLNGEIVKTALHGDVTGADLLIVDDICDGGRTFIELAKVALAKGCNSVSLYVTHGIFSKGLSVFDGLIQHIYTTDSFCPRNPETGPSGVTLHTI